MINIKKTMSILSDNPYCELSNFCEFGQMEMNNNTNTITDTNTNKKDDNFDIENDQYIETHWNILGSYFRGQQLETYNNFIKYY